MKLIKINVLKIIKTKNKFYTIFDLQYFKPGYAKKTGNLIRNYLIKNTFWFTIIYIKLISLTIAFLTLLNKIS